MTYICPVHGPRHPDGTGSGRCNAIVRHESFPILCNEVVEKEDPLEAIRDHGYWLSYVTIYRIGEAKHRAKRIAELAEEL